MTTADDQPPTPDMTDEEYGALRTSAAVWAGASVLITDERGRVLVQKVGYRPFRLLPGGAVDPGETAVRAAVREVAEELGVTLTLTRGLAVDWVTATGAPRAEEMRFPGEILHVFDGGVWAEERIAGVRLPPDEIQAIEFVEPADLTALMSPDDARRALAALRARIDHAGPVLLEDGFPLAPSVLDRTGVLSTPRARHHFPFHPAPVPAGLALRQAWCWAFAPDGRILLLLDPGTGAARLPGGAPEPGDNGDPEATVRRGTREEAAAELRDLLHLGHLSDPAEPVARTRYAAALTAVGAPPVDPATGHTYVRVLATPEQALALFDWGPAAADQLASVHEARTRLVLPRATPRPLTELDGPHAW
ncbi:NUDIX hydrolase [Streptomyces termitum]|uniref:NUDIX hydrolase n=1 Tax=Streptomyces termitum TaxID=67368 RepID=UPI0033BAC78A